MRSACEASSLHLNTEKLRWSGVSGTKCQKLRSRISAQSCSRLHTSGMRIAYSRIHAIAHFCDNRNSQKQFNKIAAANCDLSAFLCSKAPLSSASGAARFESAGMSRRDLWRDATCRARDLEGKVAARIRVAL